MDAYGWQDAVALATVLLALAYVLRRLGPRVRGRGPDVPLSALTRPRDRGTSSNGCCRRGR